jgi:hypothetical protein
LKKHRKNEEIEEEKIPGLGVVKIGKQETVQRVFEEELEKVRQEVRRVGDKNPSLEEIVVKGYQEFYKRCMDVVRKSGMISDENLFQGLTITINPSIQADKNILASCNGTHLPPIKQLNILTMEMFTAEERVQICDLFECGHSSTIGYLTLNTGSDAFDNLDVYIESLAPLLEKVTEEIFLYAFQMSHDTLLEVINHSFNAKRLCLIWCQNQNPPEEGFEFDTSVEYQTTSMSLYYSLYENAAGHWDLDALRKFTEALSYTTMVDSLKLVQAGGNWNVNAIPLHSVKQAFEDNGFSIQIQERWSTAMEQTLV